ncbi:EF-hand domain-containing protein [Mesorhizobium sp. B2-7-1]|uniref:EF-hand domain-containing protein n=1 Tax=Mesorhizobium sp. B2-7-1 TaxID=2589909 RepID=UPI001126BE30|nr:EF-hand domain-containing protein [Mesorhizobium sp. B2-7-1]TPJ56828.1 EF-hand domain-containing protein [Mesorhizobium sp. B2-7-1]
MTKIVTALAGLLLCGCSAFAADQGARAAFRRIDTNGDRKLEFGEIQAARARMFDRLDVNHNGVLEPGEVRAAIEEIKSKRDVQAARFTGLQAEASRMDRNGDGKISRDEFTAAVPDRLLQADTDGDKALSVTELRALRRQ